MGTAHVLLHADALLRLGVDHPDVEVQDYTPWDDGMFFARLGLPQAGDGYHGVVELSFVDGGIRIKPERDV